VLFQHNADVIVPLHRAWIQHRGRHR